MKMDNKQFNEITLMKIPLAQLIDVLVDIYKGGADYIDIIGVPDEVQDSIGIVVREEYISKEDENDVEKFDFKTNNGDISEKDLNDLA